MSATEPRRMTISRALEMALLNRVSRQPSVKYTVAHGRVVGAEVFAAHDDIEEADRMARVLVARVIEDYPGEPEPPEELKEELSRNAAGNTQIKVAGGPGAQERYEALCARYPTANGTTTNDAPPEQKK